mgnify:CR=1 FL=1
MRHRDWKGGWTLLAAPHASGPFLCQPPLAEPLPYDGAYLSEVLLALYNNAAEWVGM